MLNVKITLDVINMNSKLMTSLILIIIVLLISGCTGTPTYSNNQQTIDTQENGGQNPKETTVTTLNIWLASGKNWDTDADVDGIQVTLRPEDKNGKIVQTDAIINAKLWYSKFDDDFNRIKGKFIQEWSNITLSKDKFGLMGTEIRLEYKPDFKPKSMDTGWLEITMTTPDGKEFNARDDYVFLAGT